MRPKHFSVSKAPGSCFPGDSVGKEPACNAGDVGLISGSGRFPGGRYGNPLQYSCLENPKDKGARQATVHGVAKSWTQLKRQWARTRTAPGYRQMEKCRCMKCHKDCSLNILQWGMTEGTKSNSLVVQLLFCVPSCVRGLNVVLNTSPSRPQLSFHLLASAACDSMHSFRSNVVGCVSLITSIFASLFSRFFVSHVLLPL